MRGMSMFFNFFGTKKSFEKPGIEFSLIDTPFCDLYSQMYNSEKTVNTIAVFERHELACNAEVENIFVEIMKFLSQGFKTINEITNMCENNMDLLKYYDDLKNLFENLYIGNSNKTIYAVKDGIFADSKWLSIIDENCIDEAVCYLFKEINRDITSFNDIGNIITKVPCDMHFIMDILRGALTISYSNEIDTDIILEQIKKVCEKYKKPLFNEREIYR
jgi:hypothetical protein